MRFCAKQLLFILLTFLNAGGVFSQDKTVTYYADPASLPPDLPVSLKHIRAEVGFVPAERLVKAKAELTIVPNRYPVDSFRFYAPGFRIESLALTSATGTSGKPQDIGVKFSMNGVYLVVYPEKGTLKKGQTCLLSMHYECTPKNGAIYFVGWRDDEKGRTKQIWSHRPHGWLPYMDARVTMDMFYTIGSRYTVFANGERISCKKNPDNTSTWHYSMRKNHPYFSTSLVIGEMLYETDRTSGGTPLEYWYYEGMKERVPVTYKYTPEMFSFFEREMGVAYPYPVYRQAPVADYMYGAMETTTATVFGDYMLIDPHAWWQRNYVNVNAHELAHQWFGDGVAHLVNKDVWLTESFGTYYAKVFERHVFGNDYYENVRNEEMLLALDAAKRNNFPVGGSQGGVQRIYQKGSLVLDMLRGVMGDSAFRDAIRLYLDRYMFNYAETNDFMRCVYDATGESLFWFFDQWILRGGEPHYEVKYQVLADTGGQRMTRIQVWQIQETGELIHTFRMPVEFQVFYKDGSMDSKVAWTEGKYSEVFIPASGTSDIAFVLFDPGRKILKRLTFIRSIGELSAQVKMAGNMIDRYDALLALRNFPIDQKRSLLVDQYSKETFHLTKSEIIHQLSGDNTPESVEIFRRALRDKDASVRKAILQMVVPLPTHLMEAAETCLTDSSYLNRELALENLCISFPQNDSLYLAKTGNMEGWRGKNIRMKWLEIQLWKDHLEYLPELIGYTGTRYEFETRINALNLLKKRRYVDEVVLENAREAAAHWNNKLAAAGREYLNYFDGGL